MLRHSKDSSKEFLSLGIHPDILPRHQLAITERVTLAAYAAYLLFNVFALYKYGGAKPGVGAGAGDGATDANYYSQSAIASFVLPLRLGLASPFLHFINYANCSVSDSAKTADGEQNG
ncbi:hypothetical protein ACLKA7_014793 [Drosophila subpalustris]